MPVSLLALGMVIGSNNLAVALALGARGQAHRRVRICAIIGAFEFIVPLAGMRLGAAAAEQVGAYAGWLGATLVTALGVWTVLSSAREPAEESRLIALVTSWRGLVLLASGISLDNLVVGFSLGAGGLEPLAVAATVTVFAVGFTWLGLELGDVSRRDWERWAGIGSGLLLVALGVAETAGVI